MLLKKLGGQHAVCVGVIDGGEQRNVSISKLETMERVVVKGQPIGLRARVVNHGPSSTAPLEVEFAIDDRVIGQAEVGAVDPRSERDIVIEHTFDRAGLHAVTARVIGLAVDAIVADNVQRLVVSVAERVDVLLVSDTASERSALRYVRTALSPDVTADSHGQYQPISVLSAQLASTSLASFGWIGLLDVASLPASQWSRLQSYVNDGGGLFLFLGPGTNADTLAMVADAGFLPIRVVGPSDRAVTDAARFVRFSHDVSVHPVLAELSAQPSIGFYQATVFNHVRVEVPAGGSVRVLMRFSNGDPALVEHAVGRGRILVCTTLPDMDWTNLPAHGDFVSFLHAAARTLVRCDERDRHVEGGTPARWSLTAAGGALTQATVVGPTGAVEAWIDKQEAGHVELVATGLTEPGFYQASGLLNTEATDIVAVRSDRTESDVSAMTLDRIRSLAGGGIVVADVTHGGLPRAGAVQRELFTTMLLLAGCCLLSETLLASRRSRVSRGR